MSNDTKERKVSTYSLLNSWLYDGSASTVIPPDVAADKSLGQMNLLYYFRSSSYGLVISKLFNNWNLFALDRVEVLYFLKQCVMLSGYKPPFIQKVPAKKSKLADELKRVYPFLKKDEVFMIVDSIDNSTDKDKVYETFGLYSPKTKKTTKAQQKQFAETVKNIKENSLSLDNLMENFK